LQKACEQGRGKEEFAMSDLASAISSLGSIGLESYEVSQGAPVSISTVGGVSTTSVGSPLSGTSGSLIIILALVVVAIFLIRR
jgi:hypothetical protein